MQRLLTLVFLLGLAVPAGITISGCTRNPAGAYCNGEGYGLKLTDVASIDLEPRTIGISVGFGQTTSVTPPSARTCKGSTVSISTFTWGTSNNQLVDISPAGVICGGTWNRRSGGGIPDYTICNKPSPLPSTNGSPYATATITASANSITSNPLTVYVHPQVTSLSLVLEDLGTTTAITGCLSQTQTAQLDSVAYYNLNGTQTPLCAPTPTSVKGYSNLPECSAAVGNLNYGTQGGGIATIDQNGVITAEQPGTTYIIATVAGNSSSAGYFSTCPPASINVTLGGQTSGTVTQGVTQNLTTTIVDTKGQTIQGLQLNYQSTNPLDILAASTGAVTANFAGQATVYAVCQPSSCNPSPIDKVGINQTGVSVTSNPVTITTPGTASDYIWMSSPSSAPCPGSTAGPTTGKTGLPTSPGSFYFVPVELVTGTSGSAVKMPYLPNSMSMDKNGTNLYFGSCHELMVYNTSSNTLTKEDPNVPGIVLAVAPGNQYVLINDQVRKLFYVYTPVAATYSTFSGVGTAARWTPDAQTLYIVGTDYSTNPAGVPTLFVDNLNTGWTTYPLGNSAPDLTVAIPGVGAFLSGTTTTAHAWCPQVAADPTGTTLLQAYPQIPTGTLPGTEILSATIDGDHVLGAENVSASSATLYDFNVNFANSLNNGACPAKTAGGISISTAITNSPVTADPNTTIPIPEGVQLSTVEQIVPSPSASLAFLLYEAAAGSTGTATLPYYEPAASGLGTIGQISFQEPTGASPATAPVAGTFSLDGTTFYVSTSGDNLVHFINTKTLVDTQTFKPALVDVNGDPVPATVITAKPRATT